VACTPKTVARETGAAGTLPVRESVLRRGATHAPVL